MLNGFDFTKPLTRKRAVYLKCYSCCCADTKSVKECPIDSCPLYEFRPMKKAPTEEELKNSMKRIYEHFVKMLGGDKEINDDEE